MIPDGRYVYPGIAQARPEIERAVDQAIVKVARAAGFEVR